MPIYPGDPGVAITLAKSIERGDPANASRLDMGAHTGTRRDSHRLAVAGPRHALVEHHAAGHRQLDPPALARQLGQAQVGMEAERERPVLQRNE
ncbi:MAG TPA: hypothetical protein VHJ39_01380 [Solirubrobacteraceae bacterium]|nr:hypothetical protein [Solirubrobacteraceae bacterium]